MRRRQAMTLIELLAVISACSVALGFAASLLLTTMRSVSETRSFFNGERNALRLARQFRSDVHQADAASIELTEREGRETLRLKFPTGEAIKYQQVDGRIVRLASLPNEQTAREEYALGETLETRFTELDEPLRWSLHVTANPLPRPSDDASPDAEPLPRPVRTAPLHLAIEAIAGRDNRYAAAATEESP